MKLASQFTLMFVVIGTIFWLIFIGVDAAACWFVGGMVGVAIARSFIKRQ
jgi:hypothetical protein